MATRREPYCEEKDIMLGDVPPPRKVSIESYIEAAADEMDAWIGQVYVLPITFDEMESAHQADRLLLKKINSHLATGRILLMASTGAGQGTVLHAYGNELIKDARQELARITAMRTILESAELIDDPKKTDLSPLYALNRDKGSYVDRFYGSAGTATEVGEMFKDLTRGIK